MNKKTFMMLITLFYCATLYASDKIGDFSIMKVSEIIMPVITAFGIFVLNGIRKDVELFRVDISCLNKNVVKLLERDESKDKRIEDNKFHIEKIYGLIEDIKKEHNKLAHRSVSEDAVKVLIQEKLS